MANKPIKNHAFCILPWIHLYIEPTGDVFTCCLKDASAKALGNINNTPIEEIWNSDQLKQIRVDFLSGTKREDICNHCYQNEKANSFSHRKHYNYNFNKHIKNKISQTSPTGFLETMELFYWDFRFSNICNLKCRTCGPTYSSSWYNDAQALGITNLDQKISNKLSKFNFLIQQAAFVEEIYFAGGEPLLAEEHYKILDELIRLKRFDVRLTYNSNCSFLKFQGRSILDLWRHFPSILLSPSIDHFGEKSELIRKGSNWDTTLENIKTIKLELPHIRINPTLTISIFNILDLTSIIDELFKNNIVEIQNSQDITFNILRTPEFYHIGILSPELKEIALHRIKQYEQFLLDEYNLKIDQFSLVREAINKDYSKYKEEFIVTTAKLDEIRSESFFSLFPELNDFKSV